MKVKLNHHCHRFGCVGAMGDVIDVNAADARWLASVSGAEPADEDAGRIFAGKSPRPAVAAADDDEGPVLEEDNKKEEEVKPETTDARQGQKPETATKPTPTTKPKAKK